MKDFKEYLSVINEGKMSDSLELVDLKVLLDNINGKLEEANQDDLKKYMSYLKNLIEYTQGKDFERYLNNTISNIDDKMLVGSKY